MAYNTFQIGAFNFSGMNGFLSLAGPVERLRVEQRIGVDGFKITKLGKVGQLSQVQTYRDISDWYDGFSLFEQYQSAIGDDPVGMTVNGYPLVAAGFLVVIMGVVKTGHYPSLGIVGNKLESNPTAVVECSWTLMTKAIV